MLLKRSKLVYTSPLALVTVAACGSNSNTSQTYSGNVINGPLNNALVFLDLNSNGVLDGVETSVRTDENGAFSITTNAKNFLLIAITHLRDYFISKLNKWSISKNSCRKDQKHFKYANYAQEIFFNFLI